MSDKPRPTLQKPLKRAPLSEDERALELSFQKDNWIETTDADVKAKYQEAARLTKSERTNIRLSESDMEGIKRKASEKGLGYQTLIASIVHQYVSGRLVEPEVNTVVKSTLHRFETVFEELLSFGPEKKQSGKSKKTTHAHSAGRKKSTRITKHALR